MLNFIGENIHNARKPILDKQVLIDPVKLPVESFGICNVWYNRKSKYYRGHSSKEMVLANGTCMSCWDKGLGGHPTHHQENQRVNRNRKKQKNNAL